MQRAHTETHDAARQIARREDFETKVAVTAVVVVSIAIALIAWLFG